jgi:hypothetical protein
MDESMTPRLDLQSKMPRQVHTMYYSTGMMHSNTVSTVVAISVAASPQRGPSGAIIPAGAEHGEDDVAVNRVSFCFRVASLLVR